jgi:type I restriction enzyme R subunit
MEQYLHYFCGDANNPNALSETGPLRVSFCKTVATFIRNYSDIAQNLTEALRKYLDSYSEIRAAIKKHSGEELDIKPYEADMRHLFNMYVQPESGVKMSPGLKDGEAGAGRSC